MSLTALAWLAAFVLLSLASLKRPIYAALANSMVFFASPVFWWFGGGLLRSLTMRWSLLAAVILIVANLVHWKTRAASSRQGTRLLWMLAAISFNAFLVNALLANYPPESSKVFDILWKGCLASAFIYFSIRTQADLELFLFAIVVGCGFVGYQIVIGGQGSIEGGRLEGFSFPGAQGANGGSAVMALGLPLAGYFVISMRNKVYAAVSLVAAPLVLETILRCNSRGAYLGLLAAGITIVLFSRGVSRKRSIWLCVLGICAVLVMAKSEAIWERFDSIFASAEERDDSASERLDYWKAAVKMISDYPLGSGGEAAFTSPRGRGYIQHFRDEFRSVHNGPLDIAAGWGIQGLFLWLAVIGSGAILAYRASRSYIRPYDSHRSFLGAVLLAVIACEFVCSFFTSVLDGEWFLWLAVCCTAYAQLAKNDSYALGMTSVDEVQSDGRTFHRGSAD
ncbi:O-antigen ligase family protein [Stieleria sp. ICT_E10.1]|uniref:O-antigen ligase family protein n=1 Tax=Stieleria sedimenti TaxID=2976331 RepID=UPI00217F8271|nr:O-antigen ligase family protein [Stieleria sedimenti]MCS7466766.1 O-antigen ligase family protein [Stieleria sedimenti]